MRARGRRWSVCGRSAPVSSALLSIPQRGSRDAKAKAARSSFFVRPRHAVSRPAASVRAAMKRRQLLALSSQHFPSTRGDAVAAAAALSGAALPNVREPVRAPRGDKASRKAMQVVQISVPPGDVARYAGRSHSRSSSVSSTSVSINRSALRLPWPRLWRCVTWLPFRYHIPESSISDNRR